MLYTEFDSFINELHAPYTPKDTDRIKNIIAKANGDEAKALQLATNMAKAISDKAKLAMRHAASVDLLGADHPVTQAFAGKAADLGVDTSAVKKGNTLGKLGSEADPGAGNDRTSGRRSFRDDPVAPLGHTNLLTGECKWFNIYDTWGRDDDTTIELWSAGMGPNPGYRLVFTAGSGPIYKIGTRNSYMTDQEHRYIFSGEMVDWCNIGDADLLVQKYNIKSAPGYTYK